MNLQFQIRGLNVSAGSRHRLEQSLEELQNLISITFAVVVLDHTRNGGFPFTVRVHLAVPGPDIHAEGCDQTLQAAWHKMRKKLEKQIDRRKFRQGLRVARQDHGLRKLKRELPRICHSARSH